MKYIIIISALFFFSCKTQIKYPDGGFDYPKNVTGADTNLYYYQLKDIADKRRAFDESYHYVFYQMFDEPNLSIKPQPKETFRFTFIDAFGGLIFIDFNQDELIIKKGIARGFYQTDTTSLTDIEKYHLSLLRYEFPINTATMNEPMKKMVDSLLSLYPQLSDVKYYHKLYDKYKKPRRDKGTYTTTKIPITKKEFRQLVEEINLSGYWKLKGDIKCNERVLDGYSYILEANTFKKYNVVSASSNSKDSLGFSKICQKIVDLAGLGKEIKL